MNMGPIPQNHIYPSQINIQRQTCITPVQPVTQHAMRQTNVRVNQVPIAYQRHSPNTWKTIVPQVVPHDQPLQLQQIYRPLAQYVLPNSCIQSKETEAKRHQFGVAVLPMAALALVGCFWKSYLVMHSTE